MREAEFFLRELASRRYEIGALVLNRALPPSLSVAATETAANELGDRTVAFAEAVTAELDVDAETAERVLSVAAHAAREWSVVARREAAARDRVAGAAPVVVTVESLDEEVGDLAGILVLAGVLGKPA